MQWAAFYSDLYIQICNDLNLCSCNQGFAGANCNTPATETGGGRGWIFLMYCFMFRHVTYSGWQLDPVVVLEHVYANLWFGFTHTNTDLHRPGATRGWGWLCRFQQQHRGLQCSFMPRWVNSIQQNFKWSQINSTHIQILPNLVSLPDEMEHIHNVPLHRVRAYTLYVWGACLALVM